ncbi:hypothetical protein DFA_07847 [Cavenderia fasciculata]|uniref:Tyrosine-protein kinase ephrin type A/B receptor-like domain-containing protein n=1 Tax=Cavenderia fasciculata TaxID=261658 RepID=F4Q3Q1_CACFS|nr:uncharacterized protein DFA_07847 [Cavenderia fasciculata]EGG16867.1 hypothetical protein DFA_07847 [Cavenderia fasciculata]|eukprot:XP_004355341.1 hypothetical protein DFA_07847 [Cavenderia fasciculata]
MKAINIILIILLISSLICINGVDVSMYEGFAFIGSNTNSKMPFATLMSKPNRTLPYSWTNQYRIVQVFTDSTKLYGTSVAVGPGSYANGTQVVLGAVGSPNENTVYIYNVEQCSNNTNCDPIFTFQDVAKSKNSTTKDTKLSKKEFACTIGGIIGIGQNFIVSTCQNDLMSTKKSSSPIVFCFIDMDQIIPNSSKNCTIITPYESDFNPCPRERGQLYVTAVDIHKTYVSFSYCAVCMSPSSSKIAVQYQTAFEVLNVTSPGNIKKLATLTTNRTNSCPTSIALEYNWVVLGYAEESAIDLFTKISVPGNNSFEFFETIESSVGGFGSDVTLGDSLLVVATPGSTKNQDITATVVFYELYVDANGTSRRASIEATIPNLNYETVYEYGYQISYYGDELAVISSDSSGSRLGFNVYPVCPYGMEWSTKFSKCSMCQAGQFKSVSNPAANASFELCYPCPGGFYTGPVMGIASEIECRMFNCSDEEFCPEGSIYPLANLLVQTNSNSIPNPISTDELDFESTFYNSYPWFLIILGFAVIFTTFLCFPWPTYNKIQGKLIKLLLKLNFYDWDGEEMTEEVDYLERAQNTSINGGTMRESMAPFGQRSSKRGIFIRKRRTKVRPQKAVESFCSYYFLLVLGLMILFIVQFQKVNSDLSIDLRAYGQTSTDLDLKGRYTELQYLRIIDISPLVITLDLYGYSGQCITEEIGLEINGCQTINYMGTCEYDLKVELININGTTDSSDQSSNDSSNESSEQGGGSSSTESSSSSSDSSDSSSSDSSFSSSSSSSSSDIPVNGGNLRQRSMVGTSINQTCRITVLFDKGSEYSDLSSYAIKIVPTNNYYFYAQRLVYNVSTANNETMIAQGNSYVSGIVQPPKYMILRPSAEVTILSMLTFMTDCSIHSSSDDFTLVRPMVEKCEFDKQSYKDYSFISNATSYLEPKDYHDADPSFTFQVNIEKSVFFRYVTSSHSVSFGQIITVIMFSILDVFWVIEVIVPVVQTIVALLENASKRAKRKEYDEIGVKPYNELEERSSLVQSLN